MKKISLVIAFCATLAVLFLGMVASTALVSNESISENLVKSAVYFSDKDAYQFDSTEKLNQIEDNYADAILLGVIWNMKSEDAFKTTLDTKYYDDEDYGEAYGLYSAVTENTEANVDYTRYWHGMALYIRPLLKFFDVTGIRNFILFTVLALLVAVDIILIVKKQYFAAAALTLSMVCVKIWNIRLSMEYEPAFLVTMIMCIPFVTLEKKGTHTLMLLSVISGTMIGFFDFLTTETMTILIPLMLVMIMRAKDGKITSFKESLFLILKCVLAWGIAYILTFVVKWGLASAVTGESKWGLAANQAMVRFSGETEDNMSAIGQLLLAIPANLTTIFGGTERVQAGRIFIGILITAIVFGSVFYLFRGKKFNKPVFFTMILIAAIPYLRYLVLNNHSYLHEFFTYRAQSVTCMGLMAAIWFQLEFKTKTKTKKKSGR